MENPTNMPVTQRLLKDFAFPIMGAQPSSLWRRCRGGVALPFNSDQHEHGKPYQCTRYSEAYEGLCLSNFY
ncbi:hypothetical protein QYF36_022979 [Acer negundo]|nr:hypothetical protein QYF36_022979 [Acer negundo]